MFGFDAFAKQIFGKTCFGDLLNNFHDVSGFVAFADASDCWIVWNLRTLLFVRFGIYGDSYNLFKSLFPGAAPARAFCLLKVNVMICPSLRLPMRRACISFIVAAQHQSIRYRNPHGIYHWNSNGNFLDVREVQWLLMEALFSQCDAPVRVSKAL